MGSQSGCGVRPHDDVFLRPLSPGKGLAGAKVMIGDTQRGEEAEMALGCHSTISSEW